MFGKISVSQCGCVIRVNGSCPKGPGFDSLCVRDFSTLFSSVLYII